MKIRFFLWIFLTTTPLKIPSWEGQKAQPSGWVVPVGDHAPLRPSKRGIGIFIFGGASRWHGELLSGNLPSSILYPLSSTV